MKKKGFPLGAGADHERGKTYQERSFLMTRVRVKTRIPLVHMIKMHKMKGEDRRMMMKMLY